MLLFNNVLITGCGSDVAQALCRILKMEKIANQIIGCDIHHDHFGGLVFDSCYLLPRITEKNYFEKLLSITQQFEIDLIIPGSEAEMRGFLDANIINEFNGIPIILANKESVNIGLDKLATVNFLKEHGLAYPWTLKVTEALPLTFPCILKMQHGQGSKNILIIEDMELAQYYSDKRPDYIWQELLLPDTQEYTCGLYRSGTGEIRSIAINRTIKGGETQSGTIVQNKKIDLYLQKIATYLNLNGSINVQLRYTEKGPVLFEINPRFSSTVLFRHLLGFQDFLWSLLEKKGITLPSYTPAKEGIKFCRLVKEYITEN